MIEIINPIPNEVLAGGGGGGNYQLSTDSFDVALDGIPFLLATNNDRPSIREVSDIRKQMFDNFAEPGEYSMNEWWLRSQSDFGGGEGLTYQDPDVDNRFNIKFKQSTGINPWKPGEISLLPDAILEFPPFTLGNGSLSLGYFGGFESLPSVWFTIGGKLYDYDTETGVVTNILYSGADPEAFISSITAIGNDYIVANNTGIYRGVAAGPGTKIWNTGAWTIVKWVKGRLMAGIGNGVYELTGVGPALPTPKFTHLDPQWLWTSITEGPTAIYFSGGDYPESTIYKFVLDVDGAVPTLASGGTTAAVMAPGEQINTIYCYLSTFIGIATNRGFRVGIIDAQGDINYGPLLWEKNSLSIQGDDRFFYVGVEGAVDLNPDLPDAAVPTFPGISYSDQYVADGIYRVDLGQELQTSQGSSLRYAYSTDRYVARLENPANPALGNMPLQSITQVGDRFLFAVYRSSNYNDGFIALWPTDREEMERVFIPISLTENVYPKVESGYLQTGRIRYNTLEPKMFRFFSVRAPVPLDGNIDVDVIDSGGGVVRYITYTPAHPPDTGDIPLSAIFTPMEYLSLRFTLHRGAVDTSLGAVMNGWQLKALPAPIRQRTFTMTFMCFDSEQDKTGQEISHDGYAIERIQKIEQIAQRGNAILLQDLYNDIGAQVVIEQYQFVQTAPPGPVSSAYGGYITVKLKTVADVIS